MSTSRLSYLTAAAAAILCLGMFVGAQPVDAVTRAYLQLFSLQDASPDPGQETPTNPLLRVLTDCQSASCLGEFYYQVRIQLTNDTGCAFDCGGCGSPCVTINYDGPESLGDGSGRVPVNPGTKDEDCPYDQDLAQSFTYASVTYDYLRYRVQVIDQIPDGDPLYRCCTEGGSITQASSTDKFTDFYERTVGSTQQTLWHRFGPSGGGMDCSPY